MNEVQEMPVKTKKEEKKPLEKVCIICAKGALEDVYAALVMTNGAVMEGIEARLFFTFFGLDAITKERMNKVLQIGKKYKTYILSNTNMTHEIAYEEMIMMETGRASLRDFVDEVFYSHEIGLRKPNLNCYEFVIDEIDNYPSRMLFLDDRLDNVEGAIKAGMKAVQIFDADRQLNEIFGLG